MSQQSTILILGPTASGKSALAIELAQRVIGGGECISADSMQIYRHMNIGTAKTPVNERCGVPHHLIDLIEPDNDVFSVDRWLELCEQTIADSHRRQRTPIIVGGTNLYVQALLQGLSASLPAPDPQLRSRLMTLSADELRARLIEVDPVAAGRIHFNDRKRTVRAIEVFEKTGTRLSEMQSQWFDAGGSSMASHGRDASDAERVFIVGLEFDVESINRRINARVKAMIQQGLVEEVRSLHVSQRLGRNAREALGYKQVVDALEGRCSMDEAIEQIKIRTRRYAKQQRTWLRRFRTYPSAIWLDAEGFTTAQLVEKIMPALADRASANARADR